jgi:hypothetical protein
VSESKLSADALAVLTRWDMVAEPADIADECRIRDELGAYLFTVSADIRSKDLSQMLRYAERMRNDGIAIGKAGMQASLRSLIGAAAEPQESLS